MIELPLVFLGGLLGSAHCVGMCGGFALSIGVGAKSFTANLQRQLVYTLGRVLTYSFFGVAAGYAGFWLSRRAGTLIHVQGGCRSSRAASCSSRDSWRWDCCRGGFSCRSSSAARRAWPAPSSGPS